MTISLMKNLSSISQQNNQQNSQQNNQQNSQQNNQQNSQIQGRDIDDFRNIILNQIFDSYCDEKTRIDLLTQATNDCKIHPEKAAIILDMELDKNGYVNEKKLLAELEAMLRQFTGKDKKLNPKEREDAMQYVCKVRPAYSKGLAYDIAERYIVNFCRSNNVKVKTGLFTWAVP